MSWDGVIFAVVSAFMGCTGYLIGYRDGRKRK